MQTRKVFIVTVYYVQLFAENIRLPYKSCNLPDTHACLVFQRFANYAKMLTNNAIIILISTYNELLFQVNMSERIIL